MIQIVDIGPTYQKQGKTHWLDNTLCSHGFEEKECQYAGLILTPSKLSLKKLGILRLPQPIDWDMKETSYNELLMLSGGYTATDERKEKVAHFT